MNITNKETKVGMILQTESCNIQDKLQVSLNNLLIVLGESLQTGIFDMEEIKLYYDELIKIKKEECEFMENFNSIKNSVD